MQLSSFVDQIFERLRALKAQMVPVSEAANVSCDGMAEAQEAVAKL
jgi:hypothetical protein